MIIVLAIGQKVASMRVRTDCTAAAVTVQAARRGEYRYLDNRKIAHSDGEDFPLSEQCGSASGFRRNSGSRPMQPDDSM